MGGIIRFFKRIGAIRLMMTDKSVKWWKKALIIFGLVYLVLPFEVLPDFFLPVGWVDDIVLWVCILVGLKDTLDKYVRRGGKSDFSKKYKDVIDDVDYEVKETQDGK